jgi:hypothetical protein
MRSTIRALGVAAMAAGALRIVDSFTTQGLSPTTLAWLYLVTDVLLLLGIAGIYWSRRAQLAVAGTSGTVIFIIGIVLIRIAAFGVLGSSGYQLGAAVAVLGLALFASDDLLRRSGHDAAASLWLATFAFGVAGALGLMPVVMTMLAGVVFGAGFVVSGLEVARGQSI